MRSHLILIGSILSIRSNRSRPSRSSLLTKVVLGTSRKRLLVDALGGIQSHDRAIDRGQGAAGVLAEILAARLVREVEGEPLMLKAPARRGHRDAALDRHPIRAHRAAAGRAP